MKIISIANQKGGCGKTTTSINLASSLGRNGKRVLLLDLDPQAHASLGLDIESQDSIYNVISKLTPRKLNIDNIIRRVEDTFDIIPSNILVGTLEQELADEIGRELKLKEVMAPLAGRYDYVLIDCPPSLGILTVNSIRVSDEVLVPVETSRFSMQGVDHLMDIINLVRDRLSHVVKVRVLVTMFDSRLRHSFAMMSVFKERFGDLMFDTIIHINVKLKESAVMGKSVSEYDKYCRGSKDYFTLAKEIIKIHEPAEKKEAAPQKAAAQPKPSPATQKPSDTAIREIAESMGGTEPKYAGTSEEQDASEISSPAAGQDKPLTPSGSQPMSERMQTLVEDEVASLFATTFSIEAPGARTVYVTGSFNDWSLDENCRLEEKDGRWTTTIDLHPGIYKYQFIVDGVWKEDPGNPRKERNSFGDINSLIEVNAGE